MLAELGLAILAVCGVLILIFGIVFFSLFFGSDEEVPKSKSTGFQSKSSLDLSTEEQEREWGAECGVGATALWIASVRDREKLEKPPTFVDPYAERFLRNGKGHEVSDAMAKKLHHFMFMDKSGENFDTSLTLKYMFPFIGRAHMHKMRNAPVDQERIRDKGRDCVRQGIRLRTAFLDKEIGKAFGEGSPIRQFVTLASGCDCRCLRLECLQGKGVKSWCIDQPCVIDAFKAALPELQTRKDITTLAIKFGEEYWWDKLRESGFDPTKPSFFLVEGLVMYLSEAENLELFEKVAECMAPGSVLAGDYINKGWLWNPMVKPMQDQLRVYKSPWTWGVYNSRAWAARLRRNGLTVQKDIPSVQAKSLFGWWKLFLIDLWGIWIPGYRTYLAVK